jgi:hypothetical protein
MGHDIFTKFYGIDVEAILRCLRNMRGCNVGNNHEKYL